MTVDDSQYAVCYECLIPLPGVLDSRLRIYCKDCVDRLKLLESEYLSVFPLIVIRAADAFSFLSKRDYLRS